MAGVVVKAAFVTVLVVALGGVGASCQNPSPSPPPPPSALSIYVELVDGGCMKADPDGGVAAVAEELAMSKPPAWIICLAEAGTIAGCNAPCERSGVVRKPSP